MKIDSISLIIKELERVYDIIAKLNNLKAVRPIITIQTKGRQNTLGWHWVKKWVNGKKEFSELNICAENLNDNPIETLVHEMVHHGNASVGLVDCNNQGYHNKIFKSLAEKYGLNVEKSGRYGWGLTSLSKELEKTIKDKVKVNKDIFKLYRKTNIRLVAPTKMKKWTCGCTTVRCATHLSAVCELCQNRFKEKE